MGFIDHASRSVDFRDLHDDRRKPLIICEACCVGAQVLLSNGIGQLTQLIQLRHFNAPTLHPNFVQTSDEIIPEVIHFEAF